MRRVEEQKSTNRTEQKYDKIEQACVRILVVEDSPLNMEITVRTLQRAGYQVEEAVDGKQAVDMIETSADDYYQVVLMDIQMPVMDGLQAVRQIRNSNRSYVRNLIVIAMSAYADEDDVKKSRDSGMNAHLSKPVRIENFRTICRRLK